jgi:S1-C subfamily serine protease
MQRGGNQQQLRVIFNGQGQAVLVQDEGEMQRLKEKGITGVPVTDPVLRDQLRLAEGRGFAVTAVDLRSDAAKLGIEARDILISIDGRPVMQADELLKGLGARLPEIKLLRKGQIVALGAREGVGAAGEGK